MKKILFLMMAALLPLVSNAQVSLEDTKEISMSKEIIFSKTKMFISDKWNNPKISIQNEDENLGVIQVKTEKEIIVKSGMGLSCIYNYEYLTKFRFKDNKYKIEIYDIRCINAEQIGLGESRKIPIIPYFTGDNAPDKTKSTGKGISKKQAITMMSSLNEEFKQIFDQYKTYLNTTDDF